MTIQLPALPFNYDDLEPFLSRKTLELHYDKHHKGYIERLNKAINRTRFSGMSLRDIVLASDGMVFQEAAQAWNHEFYWQCLTPQSTENPNGKLLTKIEECFESFQNFQKEFEHNAINNLGSGWTWLVKTSNGHLKIINTRNADTPIVDLNTIPLLTIDVWEHAYYIDYKYQRALYLKRLWGFVNWHFVERNFYGG